jgi:putative phosphoribosyl transferase
VAFEIARALSAPLDVLAVRKLGAPGHPEYAVGAVAEDGSGVVDERSAVAVGMSATRLEATLAREAAELRRRVASYRGDRPLPELRGRTAVLVDDGIATGLTDLAAVRAARAAGAQRVVVAVPVGSADAVGLLAGEADDVVCPHVPRDFRGVGLWYEDFSEVGDDEVLALLAAARGEGEGGERNAGAGPGAAAPAAPREIAFELGGRRLMANLHEAARARGLVLFAHGSGSSRHSPRNAMVAQALAGAGFTSVLMDLLAADEAQSRARVFDIGLLAQRLEALTRWACEEQGLRDLPIGYFGASTGAAAAIRAAAELGERIAAVVSRGGRPDLAADRLALVTAPTLLVVGGEDPEVLDLNRRAASLMRCPREIAVVPGAGHLFEERGALEAVADLAIAWFERHLAARPSPLQGRAA